MLVRRLALSAFLSIAFAAAASAQPLRPTAKWVVNFDDAQCIASRNYGTEARPLLLGFKAPAIGELVQLMIVRPDRGAEFAEQLPVTVATDNGMTFKTTTLEFASDDLGQQIYRINLPLEQFAGVRRARTLSIRSGRELDLSFALDQMQPLHEVMQDCTADLRAVWHVHRGEGTHPQLRREARGDIASLFDRRDYPMIARERQSGGSATLAILVDQAGDVADCTVIRSSGIASLDWQGCSIVQERAEFDPAIGLDGRPARSAVIQRVTWRVDDPYSRVR